MKNRFRLVRYGKRGGTYYLHDNRTDERESLHTKDKQRANELLTAANEAAREPAFNVQKARIYLAASDPTLLTRTWNDVMADIIKDKEKATLKRWNTAIKDKAFDLIRENVVVMTTAHEFMEVLRTGRVSTNVYLRRLQNHCLDMGWLPVPILPRKKFPKIVHKEQRAITEAEHHRIIARERNPERRDFYELCWFFGASQSDVASLHAEDLDYERRCFVYDRLKNGNMGGMRIGPKAWAVIMRRPKKGPLFPYLITVREADRATEFKQRCEGLGIKGVTPHSYRYAWAERSANNAYPERYAQRVLGQNSKMVHRAYAKKAQGELPSLEEYEEANRKAKSKGKILVLKHEAVVPRVA